MFVDIYSLGQGEVSIRDGVAVFSVRNLQVLHGYVFERIPKSILPLACGSLGEWKASDGTMPKLEIVHHRQSPLAYSQLPLECRSRDFQKSGTQRKLVAIENPMEIAMFAAGVAPYKVDPLPFGKPQAPAKRWEVPDLGPEAAKRVEQIRQNRAAPPPRAEPKPEVSPLKGLPKDPHARPDLDEFLPKFEDIKIDPDSLNFGGPRPGDIAPGGLLGSEDVEPPEEDSYLVNRPTHCTALTARGDPCRRPVKAGTVFCGAHQKRG